MVIYSKSRISSVIQLHENVYIMKFLCFTCEYTYLFKGDCTYEILTRLYTLMKIFRLRNDHGLMKISWIVKSQGMEIKSKSKIPMHSIYFNVVLKFRLRQWIYEIICNLSCTPFGHKTRFSYNS